MSFLFPLALLALLPWAAFAAWMLVGRRRRIRVPFLPLWEAPEELRRPKKGFEPPPLALLLALLATLLALLAAARPQLAWHDQRRLTILLDRGATMSANAPDARARFTAAADALARALIARRQPLHLTLLDVPASTEWSGPPDALPAAVSPRPRTAIDTRDDLRTLLADPARRGQPLVVLSDHDLGPTPPGVIQVKPATPVHNAAITALAHRPGQVMVTVSATDPTSRPLTLRSGDRVLRQTLDLPTPGQKNLFIDFDAPTDVIEASLEGADDYPADDRACLARTRQWPTIESRSPIPDELRRMIDVYRQHRPPGESSARVALARPGDLKPDEPGVLLPLTPADESPPGDLRPTPHPITAGVDFSALAPGADITRTPPPEGWTPILRAAGRPLVAVRDAEARQVWVGFESRPFARTPAFVVFWTNVFDWLGAAGGEGFTSDPLTRRIDNARRLLPDPLPPDIDPRRWPGLFETPTGKLALNAAPVSFPPPTPDDWPARVAALPLTPAGATDLSPWFALAALACVTLAAATWERRRTPAPPRRAPHLEVETLHHVETTFHADGHVHRHETQRPPD